MLRVYKGFDIEKVHEWKSPTYSGAPLITMPNIPKPLHGINPRTLMGEEEWDKLRMKCYSESSYKCEICGALLDDKSIQLHELYTISRREKYALFERFIPVCILCHNGIHSGRSISLYRNKNLIFTKDYILKIVEHCFALIGNYNKENNTDYRLYHTFLKYLYFPELEQEVRELIAKYNIRFYDWQGTLGKWSSWKLIYNGKEYYSPYADSEAWKEAMRHHNSTGKDRLRQFNNMRLE